MKPSSNAKGFTLIELLVTISIAAVLMMIAVPSFSTFQRNAELTSITNTLMSAINAARGEAMKRGSFAMVVPLDGANWSSGWRVFVDKDLNFTYEEDKDELVLDHPAPAGFITISGNNTAADDSPYILYNGSGYSKTKAGAFGALAFSIRRNDVSTSQQLEQTRRIIVASTGRTRSCRPASDTDATCSAAGSQ